MVERVREEEGCLQKSVSFRPSKIKYPFDKKMSELLSSDNLGLNMSMMVVYFLKNFKNQKFINDLKKIKEEINKGKVVISSNLYE